MSHKGLVFSALTAWFVVSFAGVSTAAAEPIWPGQNDWSWQWEEKFARWLNDRADEPDYFTKENIHIDCADAVYAYRWIFARENDLKMAVNSHNGIFTNESENPAWSNLPAHANWRRDQRFLRSLEWMLRNTYTKSLARDSYPVRISAEALIAGAFYLDIEKGHHAQIIATTDFRNPRELPFGFLVATVPRGLQRLRFVRYWSSGQHQDGRSGFRRFLWPRKMNNGQWTFVRAEEMPHYSTEQYERNFVRNQEDTFTSTVYARVKPNLKPRAKIYLGLAEALKYVRERIKLVNDGYAACAGKAACLDVKSQIYDDWSTPSRDRRIGELFYEIDMDVARFERGDRGIRDYFEDVLPKTKVFDFDGEAVTLLQVYLIWRDKLYSSEPADAPAHRWGLDRFDTSQLPRVNRYYEEVPRFE